MDKTRYAVIGSGHGGKAVAADLSAKGYPVTLYNRSPERISEIVIRGELELEMEDGQMRSCPLELVTSDIREALENADVIMVVVPAWGHRNIAHLCSDHLRDGQVIVLNPGCTGGALEFRQILNQRKCAADLTVAETAAFVFTSRSTGPAQVRIYRTKNAVPLAAMPARHTARALAVVGKAFPQFIPVPNVFYTSLDNMGSNLNPALTLLNAGWIESTKGDFEFYVDGVTPSVARIVEALDRERVTVASALGVRARTGLSWLREAYSAEGENLYQAIQANPGYQGIRAPRNLHHRFILEDVPYGLVPLSSLGAQFGVETWATNAMIQLACAVHGVNYFERGRTTTQMGLQGMHAGQVSQYVESGRPGPVIDPRD
jgi:opine dehydrogenase